MYGFARFKPGPAPSPGIMDRLSSVPVSNGAGLALCALLVAVVFAVLTLSGCNASVGVEARSHPAPGSTISTAKPEETVTSVKTTVTTKTVKNPDGSQTITTTTCTCDGKGCVQKVDVKVVPPPSAPPGPSGKAESLDSRPATAYIMPRTSTGTLLSPDLVRISANAIPDTSLDAPASDYVLAISESDPPEARRVVLSQDGAVVTVTLDATGLNKAQTITAAKDLVATLADLTFPAPRSDATEIKVSAKVDDKYPVTARAPLQVGERPEDARDRLRRFVVGASGIFDEAYRRETRANPTTSATAKPCVDSKGRPVST